MTTSKTREDDEPSLSGGGWAHPLSLQDTDLEEDRADEEDGHDMEGECYGPSPEHRRRLRDRRGKPVIPPNAVPLGGPIAGNSNVITGADGKQYLAEPAE